MGDMFKQVLYYYGRYVQAGNYITMDDLFKPGNYITMDDMFKQVIILLWMICSSR